MPTNAGPFAHSSQIGDCQTCDAKNVPLLQIRPDIAACEGCHNGNPAVLARTQPAFEQDDSKTESAEIADELEAKLALIKDLAHEAMDLVRQHGDSTTTARAKAYWFPHIVMALDKDHEYLGSDGCTLAQTIEEIRGEEGR